jgi:hypothetical protein
MSDLASSGYLGEGTEKGAKRSTSVVTKELDRRVLCMGFRCFVLSQSLIRATKSLSSEEKHDVRSSATGTRFG